MVFVMNLVIICMIFISSLVRAPACARILYYIIIILFILIILFNSFILLFSFASFLLFSCLEVL
jgi:hypothetical protein